MVVEVVSVTTTVDGAKVVQVTSGHDIVVVVTSEQPWHSTLGQGVVIVGKTAIVVLVVIAVALIIILVITVVGPLL